MPFTERYVSVAGGGAHDGTTEADAWTFQEMITAAPAAATRVNIISGSYSEGATTMPSNGTVSDPIVLRGYNSTIGDLDDQGRNNTGELDTTNFPDFTLSAAFSMSAFCILQNLDITGSISATLVDPGAGVDSAAVVSCRIVNTANSATARCLSLDQGSMIANCDFSITSTSASTAVFADRGTAVYGCRFDCTGAAHTCLAIQAASVHRCIFWGDSGATGIFIDTLIDDLYSALITACTFYAIADPIRIVNAASTSMLYVFDNHATDSTRWLNNEYSGTADLGMIEGFNRLRDITTARTGIESVVFGEVTTDTGGAGTDYTDAGSEDFRLIAAAPGNDAGMIPHSDIGAAQHVDPAGGSGGLMMHPSMHGRIVG